MRAGIAAEYNPFHNGHLYQLKEIKKMKSELIIAVISGDFVQRGEFSLINKWEKTEAALDNGIDLIVELPVYYSIQNAEVFCREAVKILEYLEADIQVFGAETADKARLNKVIQIQNTDSYVRLLKKYLKNGESYSVSHYKALSEFGLENEFLSNNILALEYMKTIYNKKLFINPTIIKRKDTGYNEETIKGNITSASNIRKMYFNNEFQKSKKVLPEKMYEKLLCKEKEKINPEDKFFKLFKYKILTQKREETEKIYDLNENILNRFINQSIRSTTYNEFLENVKSRNISDSRIRRSILNLLLDIKKENIKDSDIEYIRVLGFNQKGREYLHTLIKEKNKNKIYTNWKDIEKQGLSKIKIEKNGFLLKELATGEKERLNSIIKVR